MPPNMTKQFEIRYNGDRIKEGNTVLYLKTN